MARKSSIKQKNRGKRQTAPLVIRCIVFGCDDRAKKVPYTFAGVHVGGKLATVYICLGHAKDLTKSKPRRFVDWLRLKERELVHSKAEERRNEAVPEKDAKPHIPNPDETWRTFPNSEYSPPKPIPPSVPLTDEQRKKEVEESRTHLQTWAKGKVKVPR